MISVKINALHCSFICCLLVYFGRKENDSTENQRLYYLSPLAILFVASSILDSSLDDYDFFGHRK